MPLLQEYNPGLASLHPGMKVYLPFDQTAEYKALWEPPAYARASADAVDAQGLASSTTGRFIWPVSGFVSSPYGWRGLRHHDGIDIPAREGSGVRAARSGHVIYAGNRIPGYGNMIILGHAGSFATIYGHLSEISVKKGQYIARGQRIGLVGMTGRTNGPHLHFEIRESRTPVDPLSFLPGQLARN